MVKAATCLLALLTLGAAPSAPVRYSDYAAEFDRFEARTRDMPAEERVAFREDFQSIRPSL